MGSFAAGWENSLSGASGNSNLVLDNGSHVGVIGGGPAGSFFSYFLLQLAQRAEIEIQVDIYERRDFSVLGPAGCNMCAGVISESLIQALSVEGINLPSTVVQRGINSFVLHTGTESVTMYAPFSEMRIATVYRGGGPRGAEGLKWRSFDGYILELAVTNGANLIRERVTDLSWDEGKPRVHVKDGDAQTYDLIIGAVGVNSPSLSLFEKLDFGYKKPEARKTFNAEFDLGFNYVSDTLGSSMHAFLLNIPNLDFAALVPKGNHSTMCLIGDGIDSKFVDSFVQQPVVRELLNDNGSHSSGACHCSPLASLGDATHPFGDRVALIGDCGVSRLNKDGIGSAYRTAKAAAVTALFKGISSKDFHESYWPRCQAICRDNRFGRIIYAIVEIIKKAPFLTRGVMRMTKNEQRKPGRQRRMSMVLWDMFTGSAPYRDVVLRSLHPSFIGRFLWNIVVDSKFSEEVYDNSEDTMETGSLGKVYHNGEVIVRQGEVGTDMYVIQAGQAEVLQKTDGKEVRLAMLEEGDIFGEMALFQQQARSATVRAVGDVRALTVDKRIFLKRVHEDPSFAFLILKKMSQRIREMDTELVHLKS
jgi:flavin-dependent dehydrogenase